LNATAPCGRKPPLAGGAAVKELPLPAAVPIHFLRFTSPAVEAHAAADARTHTDSLPPAHFKDFGPRAENADVSPPDTTRHLPVPTLALPDTDKLHTAAISKSMSAAASNSMGKEGPSVAKSMGGEGDHGGWFGQPSGGQPSGWMYFAHSETPAPSTALPSARSSMECAGRYECPCSRISFAPPYLISCIEALRVLLADLVCVCVCARARVILQQPQQPPLRF
jgi:hypothetical protein